MYAIFESATATLVCTNGALRTPKQAWDYFHEHHWAQYQNRPDGTRLSWADQDQRRYFECRLVGKRAPVKRVAGHAFRILGTEGQLVSRAGGRCACGWEAWGSPDKVKEAHVLHLETIGGYNPEPRPAENLSAAERVSKSIQTLKDQGGARKTFRLAKPALEELDRMVATENLPNHTAAIEALLRARSLPQTSEEAALYPIHVDDPHVQEVVDEAVAQACQELDRLFPGAAPDGGKGISSNFQGLLVEHVKAMLTGASHARRSHHTYLPTLLASERVFGQPFELPEEPGLGYAVLSPTTSEVLCAYRKQFVPAYRGRGNEAGRTELLPLFEDWNPDALPLNATALQLKGRRIVASNEPDILFSTHEAAVTAGLAALAKLGEAPATQRLMIVAAGYDGEHDCFTVS